MKRRPRNLRKTATIRNLVRETELRPDDLVMPYFVRPGKGIRKPIESMPGQYQFSVDQLVKEVKILSRTGVQAILLFGIPSRKDAKGSGAWAANGIVQKAIRAIKDACPEMCVMADVCLCEYTTHGHCGVLRKGEVDNDATLPLIRRIALSLVKAGADIVAPSGMMDGAVGVIRQAAPAVIIMSYAAKYASSFYAEAERSVPPDLYQQRAGRIARVRAEL